MCQPASVCTVNSLGVTDNPQLHVRNQGECGIGDSLGSPIRMQLGRRMQNRGEARQRFPRRSRDIHLALGQPRSIDQPTCPAECTRRLLWALLEVSIRISLCRRTMAVSTICGLHFVLIFVATVRGTAARIYLVPTVCAWMHIDQWGGSKKLSSQGLSIGGATGL